MPMLSNLRQIRERKLITQEQLAEAAKVARSTIVRVERQEAPASFQTTKKLAEALGVEPQELVGP